MSDPTAQEPTMEEILASIRRIISEDDAPGGGAGDAAVAVAEAPPPAPVQEEAPKPAPAAHVAAVHEPEPEEDVLELTDPEPAPAETHGDLDVFAPPSPPTPEPAHAAEPAPAPRSAPAPSYEEAPLGGSLVEDEPLLGGGAHSVAASHFGRLAQSIAMPPSGQTLDAVVRELLRPLLKDWLDEHLPAIVEEKVQAEVDRVSRRRV
jgi:cell pole-organizing protein PopZ